MTWLVAKARKPLVAASTALRHRWAYPADALGLVVSYGLFVFIFSHLWVSAYQGRADLAGYSRTALTWYFLVAELVMFGQGWAAFRALSQDIKGGQIAYTLGRPRAYPLGALAENLATSLSLVVPFALVGALIGTLVAGPVPGFTLGRWAAAVLTLLLSMVLNFLCQFTLAMSAFWLEENSALMWIHSKFTLILGTFLPLEFYPEAWRPWLEATPYAWLAYPPARIVAVGDGEVVRLVAGQVVWIATMGLVVAGVYGVGRRRTAVQGG